MFKYFDEFHKAAFYHFLISALCGALFALGLVFSQGSSKGEGIDYYIPAAVLSGIHFIMCVNSLLLLGITTIKAYEVRTFESGTRKHYTRLKTFYHLINFPCILWSIVGASMTGSTGICAKEDSRCSYTENKGVNRTFAIIIIIMHIWNGVATYWILTTSRSPSRTSAIGPQRANRPNADRRVKPVIDIHAPVKVKTDSRKENEIKNTQRIKQTRIIKAPLRRHHSALGTVSGSLRNRDQLVDTMIVLEMRRRVADDTPPDEVKPLRKYKKVLPVLGKFVLTMNTAKPKRNDEKDSDGSPALKLAPSTSSSSSSDEESRHVTANRNQKFKFHRKTTSGHSRLGDNAPPTPLPPPSYGMAVAADREPRTNPYWLPPLPQDGANMHSLPENMYSGTSFPDTELVVVEPPHVSNR